MGEGRWKHSLSCPGGSDRGLKEDGGRGDGAEWMDSNRFGGGAHRPVSRGRAERGMGYG